jgi:hypothetical protein
VYDSGSTPRENHNFLLRSKFQRGIKPNPNASNAQNRAEVFEESISGKE